MSILKNNNIQEISGDLKLAEQIIEKREPLGLFMFEDGDKFIAIDNLDGNAWTEEFDTIRECVEYLNEQELTDRITEIRSQIDVVKKEKDIIVLKYILSKVKDIKESYNKLSDSLKEQLSSEDESVDMHICRFGNEIEYTIKVLNSDIKFANGEDEDKRVCSECGKEMHEGYCVDGGIEYYCSNKCLNKHYTKEEWLDMYNNEDSESYWTHWED